MFATRPHKRVGQLLNGLTLTENFKLESKMSSPPVSTPSYVEISPSVAESDDENALPAFFSITYKSIEYATTVSREYVVFLDHEKTIFVDSLSQTTVETKSESRLLPPASPPSLVIRFIQFLLDRQVGTGSIRSLVIAFQTDFLESNDIHSLVSDLPDSKEVQKAILQTYYATLEQCALSPKSKQSALFREAVRGTISLVAVFGGQGTFNPRCFQELEDIYVTYSPFLRQLIEVIDDVLHEMCRLDETVDYYYGREIDLRSWLKDPGSVPDGEYLATAAVSFPIIGAISFAHYCVVCKVLDKTPGEIRASFTGLTGHSQGIIVAAGIARSSSWSSFYENAKSVTRILFWLGYESHRSAPNSPLPASLFQETVEHGYGKPSSMLHINGLNEGQIKSLMRTCNIELPVDRQVYLALSNTRDSFVLAGPSRSLVGFNRHLRTIKANEDSDQSRIPYDRRKPVVRSQFLPISAPFHTPYLKDARERIKTRLKGHNFNYYDLGISVYHTRDGSDLKSGTTDPLSSLIDAVTVEHVDWPLTLNDVKCSHVLAFGKGVGEIIARNKDGHGVRVIYGTQLQPLTEGTGSKYEIFSPYLPASTIMTESWYDMFHPRFERSRTGEVQLVTKFTKLMGLPPVMAAGMTPTTVHWDFVANILNAGYHAELAGGGYYNSESMSSAIARLTASIPAGRAITCNLIYVSPEAIAWQIPMLRQLSQKGYPVEGLTIGAGVPSAEVAAEYINTLGLKHISFKPGSEDAIESVIEIAKAHESFPIILQWTGGRGGGHHSYEDFHMPLVKLYGKIRQCANIVLVLGSGFGNAKDSYPYLTGEWSCQYGYARMPVDGILLGSRMMVAKEAHTCPEAKELICHACGANDSEWTKSYSQSVGGVVTVKSEMGQPIHKIATKGVLFWKEMDDEIFCLPRAQQAEAISKRRTHIIRRLNADFAKPWFGRTLAGNVIDVPDMTYTDVLHRLISLMYIPDQSRWIDKSYKALTFDFLVRCIERLHCKTRVSTSSLSDPYSVIAYFRESCPEMDLTTLHPEDLSWFIHRCKARGQKPVNFIPVLDEELSYWFKKDSLWQSEAIDAVPERDAERVCILHGPVAARYSHRTDESAKDILDGIHHSLTDMFKLNGYCDDLPNAEFPLDSFTSSQRRMKNIHTREDDGVKTFQILPGGDLPSREELFSSLAALTEGWIRAIFENAFIVQDNTRRPNFFQTFFHIRSGDLLEIDSTNSMITLNRELHDSFRAVLRVKSPDGILLNAQIFHYLLQPADPIILELQFVYDPEKSANSLHEVMDGRNLRIQSFYRNLWSASQPMCVESLRSVFSGGTCILSSEALRDWTSSLSLSYSNDRSLAGNTNIVPLNACIMPAWEALVSPLLVSEVDGDLLKLVHLSNIFEVAPHVDALVIGDSVEVTSHVRSLIIDENGKHVTIRADIERCGVVTVTVTSTFLIRGSFSDFADTFSTEDVPEITMESISTVEDAILKDRAWLHLDDDKASLIGRTLLFRLHKTCTWESKSVYKLLRMVGDVLLKEPNGCLTPVGEVGFEMANCTGNPVLDFLERKGKPVLVRRNLELPGWAGKSSRIVKMPSSSEFYSQISKDYNPIHVSDMFANLADLPSPIVHGMYTSAVVSTVLEHLVDDLDHRRMRRWSATFVDKVYPGEELIVKCQHIAMAQGRMVFHVEALRAQDGEKVLEGDAELDQVPTMYVFTGQGSQSPGMGMDLYGSSPVARKVWDDVDRYLLDSYGKLPWNNYTVFAAKSCSLSSGWSLLQIVRHNPKELTVHFAGQQGRKTREHYMAMRINSFDSDSHTVTKPVLHDLTSSTRSYTFREARGLIYSTQFAQTAITVLEKATFEDMREKGLIQENAAFSGHSLGEYGALSAMAEFMPFESLIDVVFYRGLAMQMAMETNKHGGTGYGMLAVNPSRVGEGRAIHRPAITFCAAFR